MKKKILIGLGVVVGALALFVAYGVLVGNKKSPAAVAEFNQNGLDMRVKYCRPFKKGRVIFGEKSAGALVPNGQYWRLGANASTEITFNKNVSFGGKPVNAGTYRMYAVPAADTWKIVLNSELGKWGAFTPNPAMDVVSVDVPVEKATEPSEQFTITFFGEPTGAKLHFTWDTTLVRVPVTAS